jgi:hypothetical protein
MLGGPMQLRTARMERIDVPLLLTSLGRVRVRAEAQDGWACGAEWGKGGGRNFTLASLVCNECNE